MKRLIIFVNVILGSLAPLHAEDHHSHSHKEAPAGLHLDHGKKWQTDAPLRDSMSRIRVQLQNLTTQSESNGLSSFGKSVQTEVATMIKNCKLKPEADGVLHHIIAQLLAGSEVLTTKRGIDQKKGLENIQKALHQYGEYFDHHGW